jgi:tRNA(fMet)-specific endonuclease VapC
VNRSLLDTDILSEVGKAIDPNVVAKATSYRRAFGRFTISVISIMEIVRGFQQKQSIRRLHLFLAAVAHEEIVLLNRPSAELAGRIAGDLDRIGQPVGKADPMIAAIAIEQGLELVTGNTSHYLRIAQLGYPLILNNWR